MEPDFLSIVLGIIFVVALLKAVTLASQAAWEGVKPAVVAIVRFLKKLVALIFWPFKALFYLIFGKPETEQGRWRRESEEREAREFREKESRKNEELEQIRRMLDDFD